MRKLKNQKGFTLVEMLVCIITLMLIGLICSVGMNLAMKSLNSISFDANSRMFESTMDIYISDLLRHATDIENRAEGVVFTNESYYIRDGKMKINTAGSGVTDAGYLVCTGGSSSMPEMMLANKGVYADNLYIKNFSLSYDETTGIFSGGYQIVSSKTDSVRNCSFRYRTVTQYIN